MTRFARAKGSKACNEKIPEDGTPWEIMKEQLLQAKKKKDDSKNRHEAEKQRIDNYENFLKEQKTQKRKAMWFNFPESDVNTGVPVLKKKKNKQKSVLIDSTDTLTVNDNCTKISVKECGVKNEKKKKKGNKMNVQDIKFQTKGNTELSNVDLSSHKNNEKSMKKNITKRNKSHLLQNQTPMEELQNSDLSEKLNDNELNIQKCFIKTSKKNKNKGVKNKILDDQTKSGKNNSPEKKDKAKKNKMKKNQVATTNNSNNNGNEINSMECQTTQKTDKETIVLKQKNKKSVDGKPVRRKALNDRSFQLIINGKEVELMRFDGFPIMKKDAERLQELKNKMMQKGIPKSEIQRTMKLERRRAEKALARLKRDVCYNCRKGGHNLSDCPELKSKIPGIGGGEGICFKCGSTEHRQFECKVQKDKEFRFATCFICKEPGHIARQCPDNPKGLYPNGGCCKLCGDVTHLRKDCPTVMEKKEEKSLKLSTLDSGGDVEGIGQPTIAVSSEPSKKVKKIKF